jgi:hypothetical protein
MGARMYDVVHRSREVDASASSLLSRARRSGLSRRFGLPRFWCARFAMGLAPPNEWKVETRCRTVHPTQACAISPVISPGTGTPRNRLLSPPPTRTPGNSDSGTESSFPANCVEAASGHPAATLPACSGGLKHLSLRLVIRLAVVVPTAWVLWQRAGGSPRAPACCQPRASGLRLCRRRPLWGLMARTTRKSAVSTSTMLAPLATSNQ